MATAILVDGGFFIKRFRSLQPDNAFDPQRAAECIHRWASAHLSPPLPKRRPNGEQPGHALAKRELYRIFFYDCPPLDKKLHNPISKRAIDFSKSNEALFRLELTRAWRQSLLRRSQKHRLPWRRFKRLVNAFIPYVRLVHPYPAERFRVKT